MKTTTMLVIGISSVILAATAIAAVPQLLPKKTAEMAVLPDGKLIPLPPRRRPPVESLVVVRKCKPPFMRHGNEFVGRDSEGQLWFVDNNRKMVAVADGPSMNEVCKKL